MADLILYFSRTGENMYNGKLRVLDKGCTEIVAEQLAALTGAALFRAEQAEPYASDYNTCIAQAKRDLKQDRRPALKAMPDPAVVAAAEVVYVGYPNYWGTVPMPMWTLLDGLELGGKTIRPFCTHEGSGLARSEGDILRLCPGSKVEKGIAIRGAEAAEAGPALKEWLGL